MVMVNLEFVLTAPEPEEHIDSGERVRHKL